MSIASRREEELRILRHQAIQRTRERLASPAPSLGERVAALEGQVEALIEHVAEQRPKE